MSDRTFEIPDGSKVLIGTPNYTNLFSSEVHANHVECVTKWKEWGIDFNWMIIGRTFVHFARSQACRAAVNGGFTHIFWLDDDAIIDPILLPIFLEHDKDVVIAPYPMRRAPFQIGILSARGFRCREGDPWAHWEEDCQPPSFASCEKCGKEIPRDFHEHVAYRNMTSADLGKGLIEVDGGGTHAMLIKTSVLTKSRGFPPPGTGELVPENRSYPDRAYAVYMKLKDMTESEDRDLVDHYIGDLPDQSATMQEEDGKDKPYFTMPKQGTEDMLACLPDGIMYGDFNDISVPSQEAITHMGRKEEVVQYHKREYSGELVRIKPLYTEALRLTPNHPVFTSTTSRRWTPAGDLKVSSRLFFPKPQLNDYTATLDLTAYASGAFVGEEGIKFQRTTVKSATVPLTVQMTPDLAWLFGFYVAEGNCTKNLVAFAYNAQKEQEYSDRIQRICRESFGITNFDNRRHGNSGQVRFTNTVLARFFGESFGKGASNKHFPKWISDNLRFSGEALRGLWDGDGMIKLKVNNEYLESPAECIVTSISRSLVHQVKNLLAANGVFASIRVGSNKTQTNYTVRPLSKYRKLFGELIGVELPGLSRPLKDKVEYVVRANGLEGWWIPIESITREPFEGLVYNAGVSNARSYVLNGIAVHNCYRWKCKGVKIYCDTDVFADHVGFAPVIGLNFVQQMEALRNNPDPEQIVFAAPGLHARDWGLMRKDARASLT